ncbi:hypothetical protein SDC9_187517 [bioreactor metagenome]|uniref:Secretion system C-terminal sorting domain-containing protein n=1 Tax=bioreactor metagenome TaxID=1076179 RepID=A0A645HNF3_9ZZZZ
MQANASYAKTAKWDVKTASVDLTDNFFEKTNYRGAFGTERWDLPWAEYDPVNAIYKANSVEDEFANSISLMVSPNPVNETTTISYFLNNSGTISIKLFDAAGNLVTTFVNNEIQEIGNHQIEVNVSKIKTGMYYLQIGNDGKTNTISFPITK